MKKSEQTKAKLVNAVINLINKGQKISVASISKEAKQLMAAFTDISIILMKSMKLQLLMWS